MTVLATEDCLWNRQGSAWQRTGLGESTHHPGNNSYSIVHATSEGDIPLNWTWRATANSMGQIWVSTES